MQKLAKLWNGNSKNSLWQNFRAQKISQVDDPKFKNGPEIIRKYCSVH